MHRPAARDESKAGVGDAFDREMLAFMNARQVPGGSLAVVKDGRLVYAKGYGWANREKKIPVTPASLFRIASISKPITAVAVLKLVEDKKLDLEARAFDLLRTEPVLKDRRPPDARLSRITVRHLLQHTGGENAFSQRAVLRVVTRLVCGLLGT